MRWLGFAAGGIAVTCALFSGIALRVGAPLNVGWERPRATWAVRVAACHDAAAVVKPHPPICRCGPFCCCFPGDPADAHGSVPFRNAGPGLPQLPLSTHVGNFELRPVALWANRMPRCAKPRAAPRWPASAARLGISSGSVLVAFDLTADGEVANARVVDSAPRGVFDREALRAVSSWCYPPAGEGEPEESRANRRVRIRFESEGT